MTADEICLSRLVERGQTHVCHEDRGHDGAHICMTRSCNDTWTQIADMPTAPAPVAAAESRGRVTGWREAIEALRDGDGYQQWYHAQREPRTYIPRRASAAADFLESLAPKETP